MSAVGRAAARGGDPANPRRPLRRAALSILWALLDDAYARRMAGLHTPDVVVATTDRGTGVAAPAPAALAAMPVVTVPSAARGVAMSGEPSAQRSGRRRLRPPVETRARAQRATGAPAVDTLLAHARVLARTHGVDVRLVEAVIRQESNWNPASVSKKGAVGLMQLMPATAALLGVDAHDPFDNIRGGVTYLADLIRAYGNVRHALIAYNAGPAHANRVIRGERTLYAETRRYLAAIAENYPL